MRNARMHRDIRHLDHQNMFHCRAHQILWMLLLPVVLPAILCGQQPITASPGDRLALEGSSFTHYPIGRHNARLQTLHDDIPAGAVVSGHAYRRDAIGIRGQLPAFDCELEVTLSVSANSASTASSVFASNLGSSSVVALPRTTLHFPSTSRPSLDPAPTFELMIPYAVPFVMPASGGTLCVDIVIFGNQTPLGNDRNLSVYLDAHEQFADGSAVQPGFRLGTGCAAPGNTRDSYANLDFWSMANGTSEIDISIRHGVASSGNHPAFAFLTIGNWINATPWPLRPDCTFWSSSELWFSLPGSMTASGTYDDQLTGLPLLPAGYRLWCQAGSIDLATVATAFGDAITFVTPPYGMLPIPCARIASASDRAASTGAVSRSVPVMAFF